MLKGDQRLRLGAMVVLRPECLSAWAHCHNAIYYLIDSDQAMVSSLRNVRQDAGDEIS